MIFIGRKKLEKFIGFPVYGNRCHFIKFEFPTTWEVSNQAKFLYDTTIGFNDRIGFKVGIAFPFFSVDRNMNFLPLIELPLIVMDAAMWGRMKLSEASAIKTVLEIFKIIKQYHGLLTILWHQCTQIMRGGRIYEDLLKFLIEPSAYIANGLEIAKWWRTRNEFQLSINPTNSQLTIEIKNPLCAENVGLLISGKQLEVISTSSNLKLIEKTPVQCKFLFLTGNVGHISISTSEL